MQQFASICASTFIDVFSLHFEVKFDQLFVQRALRSRLTSNLESSEAYLLKLEKNLSLGFEIIDIFCKTAI